MNSLYPCLRYNERQTFPCVAERYKSGGSLTDPGRPRGPRLLESSTHLPFEVPLRGTHTHGSTTPKTNFLCISLDLTSPTWSCNQDPHGLAVRGELTRRLTDQQSHFLNEENKGNTARPPALITPRRPPCLRDTPSRFLSKFTTLTEEPANATTR